MWYNYLNLEENRRELNYLRLFKENSLKEKERIKELARNEEWDKLKVFLCL